MSDFDHIKSLLAPQCPQLTARELDNLAYDIFVAITWADIAPKATGVGRMTPRLTPPPCEQLCQ